MSIFVGANRKSLSSGRLSKTAVCSLTVADRIGLGASWPYAPNPRRAAMIGNKNARSGFKSA